MLKRGLFVLIALLGLLGQVHAQTVAASTNNSAKITTGLTYQTVLAAVTQTNQRRSLTIENNNASDACYIEVTGLVPAASTTSTSVTVNSVSLTAQQASIMLLAGGSYTRYYPYVPAGAIVATCATTGDSLYVDIQ